ncbi:aminophospholipid-transporting P-type ATPase [Lentinus tigrinus ALCF2SS1-7]|uniref:Aminophospholipid-transporting P-type ATPase n=1 Tax=Lentinus tigrinus ALCF2SS1-6 TaxID=1328759 RepID=A0A5C2S859_9APHY|nr:aminophospholipid-transporting P-type ATPase [Lentinus tigrinus ALCF2SS1-6]RPD73645.1 aminophospholipid-transporting P-type ATPase [Lentinus tigrinus ALCF2SS1-7]
MKREMTKEDKELADAGYEHLKQQKPQGQKEGDGKLDGVDIHEHKLGFQELQTELDTTFDAKDPSTSPGLSSEEAKARLSRDGPNILTPPKKKSALRKYYDCLMSMFNILLIIAGVLEYILLGVDFKDNFPNTYLGGILIGVAFLNALIEFYQLQKSEAILASFLAMIPPSCRVVRDGALITVPAADLVKGDIVLVRSGDKTPADLILFAASDLKVDNSSLTGESEPQERLARPAGVEHRPVEAENLLFNSTLIVNGEGWGVVVRTGDHTMIGQIAALTGNETGKKSPLAMEIGRFVMMVSAIAIVFAVVFFIVGITTVYQGRGEQTVTFAVSILVAFVPEGLPSVVTLLLSIAAKRMAAQNVLVKDLQGVETLGKSTSLTLLATDKTGTLTRNQMTVTNLWSGLRMFSAFQSNNDSEDTQTFALEAPGMREMVDIAALNSHVKFDKTDIPFEQRKILGDATETGLIRFAGKYISDYDGYQKQHPKAFEIPFNSSNKWALVILEKPHKTGLLTAYLKGAPERILAKCSTYLKDGKEIPITDDFRAAYDEAYDYMASRGHRVIACAQKLLPGEIYDHDYEFSKNDAKYPSIEYCFCGLISLEDPPKHGVREAIGTLRLAGIKVMMVTGDHPKTAEAIARKINLILGDTKESLSKKTGRPIEEIYEDEIDAVVIHGDDIDSLQGWQWDQIFAKNEIVFARTSPQHKLEIVKRAQALGHIVGVTGDGVNDSPALKKADLGIAMNISGSDVSKEAANMILLDDNFASTVKGVAEGRQIFVNLKRSIQYTISHSTPEVIPQLLYVVVPLPLPLSAILILVIDLGFELFVALSFAWDKPETKDGLMRMLPRRPVNDRSIMSLKRRALRRTKTLLRDPETQEVIQPSKFSQFMTKLNAPFTRQFWEDALERSEDETLVDGKLLSYAYLEAGMIEFAGAIAAYFVVFFKNGFTPGDLRRAQSALTEVPSIAYFQKDSPDFINSRGQRISGDKQVDALGQAQSIVYLSIFIIQCFNVFAVKAKFRFPFGKSIVGNYYNFAGIIAGACLGMFIVYTPPLHVVFGGSVHLSPLYWLIPVGFGVLLLVWASIRVLLMRKSIEQSRVKDIKGLMMFPTMRTMSMRSKH